MTTRLITNDDLTQLIGGFERSLFRCERQPSYLVPEEADSVAQFLDGIDHDPTTIPYFRDGFALLAEVTTSGRTIRRVRVHDQPPNDYQRWLRWLGKWNRKAGEEIAYLDRSEAVAAGLAPSSGYGHDFWLFDDRQVVIMRFGADNSLVSLTLSDEPETVANALDWRERATHLVGGESAKPV